MLDIREENEGVAYWSLLLSQLPFIYHHLSQDHLELIARNMVVAVMAEGATERGEDGGIAGGITVVQLVSEFLESEGFVEMKSLQELMLSSVCAYLLSHLRRR